MIVADTNLIAYLLMPGDHTKISERVFDKDPQWLAPLLWRSEMRNVLAAHLRRDELTIDAAIELMELAETLMLGNELMVASDEILALASRSRRSAYDCEFVVLAQQQNLPLVTTDRRLLETFASVAVHPQAFVES